MIKTPKRRTRTTISISEDILSKVDSLVDGLSIRSRSQAVEYVLTKALSDKLSTALVLAGGKPSDISIDGKIKFMVQIGKKALLEHVLDHLHGFGINRFIVYLDYKKEEIVNYFSALSKPYNITFINAERASGTVRPLLMAKDYIRESFLLAYGDTICRVDLGSMYAFHKDHSSIMTIALTSVDEPKKYGVAVMEGPKIRNFVEKPKSKVESYLVNSGYFIIEPTIFSYIQPTDKSIERDILPRLSRQGIVYGYPFQGLYLNINKRLDIEKANILL
ncbi:MAG: sugar phosphate nucleotidyltransferase [Candidatus Diapherotrites archaeon]|nr:sugar phosphate nucleotidyltransferase [Candidatus Diapherotrites archaeon]